MSSNAVRFVQHQNRTPVRLTSSRVRKSYSLPGVAMTTCAPLRMACNCGFSPRPPDHTAARMPLPAAILPKASANLDGEFARGAENHGADTGPVAVPAQQLDQWQNERKGLPGAGFAPWRPGRARPAPADSQGLHGRGFGKAVFFEVALQESGEREF